MKRTEERWKWRWNKGEKRNKLEGEETGKEYMIGVGKRGGWQAEWREVSICDYFTFQLKLPCYLRFLYSLFSVTSK